MRPVITPQHLEFSIGEIVVTGVQPRRGPLFIRTAARATPGGMQFGRPASSFGLLDRRRRFQQLRTIVRARSCRAFFLFRSDLHFDNVCRLTLFFKEDS